MSEAFDDRYVTFREHALLKDQVTALQNRLAHVPDQLTSIDSKVNEINLKMASAPAQNTLPVPYIPPPQEIVRNVARGLGIGPTVWIILSTSAALTMAIKQMGW